MRIVNPQPEGNLLPELREALARLRRRRGFDANRYVRAKAIVLNRYMRDARLDACVVGVSGGVDSAVALGLASRAKAESDSPIREIVAVMMPVFDAGATHQGEATARGREVAQTFGIEPVVIDISAGHAALKAAVDDALGVSGEPWASGQLVSYARTPALYYITSLLTQQGHAGVLLGTTNRDEGGYLGFIGKASDAMVDLQILSDLHKSEVYRIAHELGVPDSVLAATPTGDMYDARPDEEVFGAPYDFVELYLLYKDLVTEAERDVVQRGFGQETREQFAFFAQNLEELHRYNRHKYIGKSPAVHLDVLHASTPGGWNNSLYLLHTEPTVDTARLNGPFELCNRLTASLNGAPDPEILREPILNFGDSAMILRGVFRPEEIEALLAELDTQEWVPVGLDGRQLGPFSPVNSPAAPYPLSQDSAETTAFGAAAPPEERDDNFAAVSEQGASLEAVIGSWRATTHAPVLARTLWNRIGGHIGSPRVMDALTPTDWDGTPVWQAVGINPVLRFIRYRQGGALIPHYDAPFIYHEGKRTLVSVLLYLEAGDGESGATRFIGDPQAGVPVSERNLDDWPRFAAEEEVLLRVPPEPGTCLLLDHRILHDGEACAGTAAKTVLRTDIVFERCGVVPTHA